MSVVAKCIVQAKLASDSAREEYAAPTGSRTIIDKFTATNTDSSSRTLSIYLVASGASASASNLVIDALSIAAHATANISELQNHILNSQDSIVVLASVDLKVVIRASGREVT